MPALIWIVLLVVLLVGGGVLHAKRVRALERRLAERASTPRRVEPAAALDSAKSRILLGLLNELRTPLMLLRGKLRARTLAGTGVPESTDIADLLTHADRIRHGVDQLTEILELDLGDARLDSMRADLVEVVRDQVSALKPAAERHGISLAFTSEPRVLPLAFDRPKVERALYGLLHRVFEDASPGDHAEVTITRATRDGDEDVAVIELRDTGRPMDERFRKLLVEEEHWTAFPDAMADLTGLSLALTRRFVGMHGGTVRVETDDAGGTAVRLTLPLTAPAAAVAQTPATVTEAPAATEETAAATEETAPAPEEEPDLEPSAALPKASSPAAEDRPEASPAQPPRKKDTTVLVVDDNADTRLYLRHAFGKHHNVLEAADGKEALEKVREHMPDLVVSDIMMPVMNGQELCQHIKEDETLNHIPVMLVTANVVPDVKMQGLGSGADDYLVKPFDVDEALLRIDNMIRTRSQLRERYSREVVIAASDIAVTPEEEAFLERARTIVEAHIGDGDFGVQELSTELGMSSRQLQRKLRETVDQSPVEFMRTLRLQRAAQLLEQQFGNVSEVAYAVGFTSLSYFAKCFRDQYGQSPSEYKSSQS